LRTAYVWLFVSLAMLVFIPVYQFAVLPGFAPQSEAAQIRFSHAYYGAVRHAITVGFVSLMIVGVAAKVVPILNGVDVRALSPLWGPFFLINIGCTLRVFGQVSTDFVAEAFPVTAISGVLEVTGLALWGSHLCLIMLGRPRLKPTREQSAYTPVTLDAPIVGSNRVGDVLDLTPALLETFICFGFRPLANPIFRKTIATRTTIDRACRMMGVDANALLSALNVARARVSQKTRALPMVAASPNADKSTHIRLACSQQPSDDM
jgi:hypothetical protein